MEKILHNYETVMILNTKLGDEGVQALAEKFKALIAENGTIGNVDEWGKRRLAYPIQDEAGGVLRSDYLYQRCGIPQRTGSCL